MGTLDHLLFDDKKWAVRYLVIKTGGLLVRHAVLVSPRSVKRVYEKDTEIKTYLTKAQLEDSPEIDAHQPITRQQEKQYHLHLGLPFYWAEDTPGGTGATAAEPLNQNVVEHGAKTEGGEEQHLQSTRDMAGFTVRGADGDIGRVGDFLIDEEEWDVRFIVVDTGSWLPGRKVPVFPQWVQDLDWPEKKVVLALTKQRIRTAPEVDPSGNVSRDDVIALFNHYGAKEAGSL